MFCTKCYIVRKQEKSTDKKILYFVEETKYFKKLHINGINTENRFEKRIYTAIHCKKYKKFPKTAPEQYKHRTYVGMKKGLTNECHV